MKRLTIFLFVISISILSEAQTYVGLKTGLLTTPFLLGDNSNKYASSSLDYQNSFFVTGVFKYKTSHRFSIGSNLSYSLYAIDYSRKWWSPEGDLGSMQEGKIDAGYLGLYIYPQLNFGKKVEFFINIGPYFGNLTNSRFKGEYENEQVDSSAKDDLTNMVIALQSTLGLKFNLNETWSLTTDLSTRYSSVLIPASEYENQLDVIYSVGFLYQLNNKSKKK